MSTLSKKILFIVTKSGMGGASRYVFDLAHALCASNTVLVAAGFADSGVPGELLQKCSQEKIQTIPIPNLVRDVRFKKELKTFFFFLNLFKQERPDVVHLNSPKAGGLGALAARIVGIKKIIYTAHGWAFFEDRPLYQKTLIYLFSYITILLSTKTIAVSKRDLHAFNWLPFAKQKITYIPNGIPTQDILSKEDARDALHSFDITRHTTLVGAIAELHTNKGLRYLIEAMQNREDTVCIIIGEGEERDTLEKIIVEYNLENSVYLAGYIENAARLISAFDIFVLPSLKEGLPFVLLEAGAQGLPVIATNVGGIPDLIEHEKTGLLVPPKNSTVLADSLVRLQSDATLRTSLSSALKQKIEQDFSLDLMVRSTLAVYKI